MMKPPVQSEEEISKTLLSLLDAYETADIPGMQKYLSRDIDIHVHELDLRGCTAFFKIYRPEKLRCLNSVLRRTEMWGGGMEQSPGRTM